MSAISALDVQEDTAYVRFWNEVLAPKFIRFKHVLVDGLSKHSEAVFPTLPVREGDRVLDVGCGFGDTSVKLAAMVGSTGEVVGIDCCDAFLDYARKDVENRGIGNLRFVRGDAEIALPVGEYDFCFARFGTMFFANPVAGLRNMRRALRPGGRMVHIVWRNRADNLLAFHGEGRGAALPAGTRSRRADLRARPLLDGGRSHGEIDDEDRGYDRIEFRRVDAPVLIGADVADAVAFQLAIGPAARCSGRRARKPKTSGRKSRRHWQRPSSGRRHPRRAS